MLTVQKNYEIIGMKLTYDVAEWNKRCLARFDPVASQDLILNDAKEFACLVHLGYIEAGEVRDIVRQGADWAVKYFQKGDTREMNGGWYMPLSRGMFLCLLTGDNDKLVSLCSQVKPTKRPEYKGPLEDEVQVLYLVLASIFQQDPDKRFEKLRAKIAACRTKNVRVLSRALDAVALRDPRAFPAAIVGCVEHHKTKPKPDPDAHYMEDWLPLHANAIYLAGLRLGLERPNYPAEIAAYLMTPESIGLGT